MTFETMMLYFVVSLVICGFIAAAGFILKLQYKEGFADPMSAETDCAWGPKGYGKQYPSNYGSKVLLADKVYATLRCDWSYPSAYNLGQTVYFNDPADAYEYVVGAVRSKNRALERLENSMYRGKPHMYEELWCDTHVERDYWLEKLTEFEEDC